MSKHTKGPWKAKEKYGTHWIQAGKQQVCAVDTPEIMREDDEVDEDQDAAKANAALIAAAPDMLAVLEALAEFWKNGTPVAAGSEVADDALALLKKLGK